MCDRAKAHPSEWLIDSGCTSHMMPDETLFKTLDYNVKANVKEIYVQQPEGFVVKGKEESSSEPTMYVRVQEGNEVVISIYVDDLLITGSSEKQIGFLKKQFGKAFEMTDLGLMKYFLGMEIEQSEGRIRVSQKKYVRDVLKKFNLD
ncbi:hypothetical protein K2173_008934 [Erythroxylum novogranatense]|uniref:Reverse transcriptase n=1 Tax=Erythroxylum novogranatense TaxID=1862640 RepID=A0AAV8TS71_9ROSI|nr:hypothetical protein K2173_008934 [Erythroxylum novogranatense]